MWRKGIAPYLPITVKYAYKLIKKVDLQKYKEAVEAIGNDYRAYLRGEKKKGDRIGTEPITVDFLAKDAINTSIEELKRYLYSISSPCTTSREIESFAEDARGKMVDNLSNVSNKTVTTALSEDQLNDINYLINLLSVSKAKACDNSGFFDSDLITLLRRYHEKLESNTMKKRK